MIDLVRLAETDRVTKVFDGTTVPAEKMRTLFAVLRSAPTSFNFQATHFVVASSPAARARIAKSMEGGFEANVNKVVSASHTIAFCTRASITQENFEQVIAQEKKDGAFKDKDAEDLWRRILTSGIRLHDFERKDMAHWLAKQTYLAMGVAMMACAELGIDVCPMEGFFAPKLDAEFGLRERGYTSTLLLSLGRRAPDDYILKTPKSRFSADQMFTFVDG